MMRHLLAALLLAAPLGAQARHVVFVTIDGVRPEELFGGIDSVVVADPKGSGVSDTAAFRSKWWRATAPERRRLVMPFLWDTLVPRGVLFGAGRGVTVTNGLQFSAPGYIEMFTGHARADVTSNADRRYAYPTLFEVIATEPGRRATDVAAFTSWTTQARLTDSRGGTFVSQGPFEPLPAALTLAADRNLHEIEDAVRHEDRSIRYDVFTHRLARNWLTRFHPILLHIGYGETDVDAHSGEYDRYIEMLQRTDRMLSDLWHTIESDSLLRGTTTLVVTTDHGRGATSRDWGDHGRSVTNAAKWWFFAVGAGVSARGVVSDPMTQSQTAATVLRLLGRGTSGLASPVAPPIDLGPAR